MGGFGLHLGFILGGFWDHFGCQKAFKKSKGFFMRFWGPHRERDSILGVGLAECAGSLGRIMEGYKIQIC